MDKLLHILPLCLPWLTPKQLCMIKCTCRCSELRDLVLSLSWQDHSIDFELDGSVSAIAWLHKNIWSMQKLRLSISLGLPGKMLQDVLKGCRKLTCLCIKSKHIEELPPFPLQLQQLDVAGCSKLRELPVLPPTLQQLNCKNCQDLEAMPGSLSSTAVSVLNCCGCDLLESLPQLPPSLVELDASCCDSLRQLPALPEGLKRLNTAVSKELAALPELPASLTHLDCYECSSLKKLPQVAHTSIMELDCRDCSLLEELPDMPDSLEKVWADGLNRADRLPRLPTERLKLLSIDGTAISELLSAFPNLEELWCEKTPIQQLPELPSCTVLSLAYCKQLQQLPEQLPAGLVRLNCSRCSGLQQLPAQLPRKLEWLSVYYCTALQQLPELPPTLREFNCEGCSSLRQLPDLSQCQVQRVSLKGCGALKDAYVGGCTLVLE